MNRNTVESRWTDLFFLWLCRFISWRRYAFEDVWININKINYNKLWSAAGALFLFLFFVGGLIQFRLTKYHFKHWQPLCVEIETTKEKNNIQTVWWNRIFCAVILAERTYLRRQLWTVFDIYKDVWRNANRKIENA